MNQILTKQNKMDTSYVCRGCAQVNLITRDMVKERPLPNQPKISEIGFVCPHCQAFTRKSFISNHLVKKQAEIEKIRAQVVALRINGSEIDKSEAEAIWKRFNKLLRQYQNEYNSLNNAMNKRYGIKK